MYQVFLRRRAPSAFATPAWMAEMLQSVPAEHLEKTRQDLFDVSASSLCCEDTSDADPAGSRLHHGCPAVELL